ncbi:MAG: SDR family NAD(P)-dependent oxidoreductase [Myxococcales bacterium]|nr:SDR family NAD(P)-dependent oxidoreductase [Myxococcales bacterium]
MSRRVVITGGNRGLGLATARALAQAGDHVILTARDAEKAQAAAAALQAEGLAVDGAALDVSSDASVEAFFAAAGPVDVLINNAGVASDKSHGGSTLGVPPSSGLVAFDTNTLGAWRTLRQVLPGMNARGYGRVVNVSSGMGGLTEMDGGWPGYRISKAALNAVTRIFSHETRGDVKVNSVCPGWVRTDMGGPHATRGLEEGIAGIVWAAGLPADGPNGGFFRDGVPLAW